MCCQPDCAGNECGDDGCGDPCPPGCDPTESCVSGACVPCVPDCAGKNCGPDGCGGVCGQCGPLIVCKFGECR